MTSTTATKTPVSHATGRIAPVALAVVFWLTVWHLAAWGVGRDFLLASPVDVLRRLAELSVTVPFWATVGTSLLRIAVGFVTAMVVGGATAALAERFRVARILLEPLVTTIRSMPVVSFIILVLLWTDASWLAAITSFLIVWPLMHATLFDGIRRRDRHLVEMTAVFKVAWWRRFRSVDVPAVTPYLVTACTAGIGMAWKAGVAAEVIGIAHGSIGARLYEAKLFLASADVFAWTLVIVIASVGCQKAVVWLIRRGEATISGRVA